MTTPASPIPTFRCFCGGVARPVPGPASTVIRDDAGAVVVTLPVRSSKCGSCGEVFVPAEPVIEEAKARGRHVELVQEGPALEILN